MDKIGFLEEIVELFIDILYIFKIFKEVFELSIVRFVYLSKYYIFFGYEGKLKDLSIILLFEFFDVFILKIIKDIKIDILYYWFKLEIEIDLLLFLVGNKE